MKRIGLITLYKDNYGSELQCFATKEYLKKIGYSSDLLDIKYLGRDKLYNKIKHLFISTYYSIRYKGYYSNRKALKKEAKVSLNSRTKESQLELDLFEKASLQPKMVDKRLLSDQEFLKQYDYFIVGSDQVWSGSSIANGFRFLNFAPIEKRIALCPSFGVDKLKEFNKKPFKKYLDQFRFLSAREETGVQIIKELTGREVPRLADPINFLTQDEWKQFAENGKQVKEKYIFVHFLDKPNDSAINAINLIAEKFKLKKICFATPHEEYSQIGDHSIFSGSPIDYVSLIEKAEFVCSDSFHTSSFAIMFSKRFFVFERSYLHGNKQSTRIVNLLNTYNCSDRYIKQDGINEGLLTKKPSFDEILETERNNLQNYLLKALSSNTTQAEPTSNILQNNEIKLKSSNDCVGCMACLSICPKKAISVNYSEFGYRIPTVNTDLCINCGLCEKVCYIGDVEQNKNKPVKAYIAHTQNKEFMQNSASSGVFAHLAKSFIANGDYVCGAKMDFEDGLPTVNHVIINSLEDLTSLLGSKYVESNCKDVYKPISKLLAKGEKLLFCGTSCQVKGLLNYLNTQRINTDNLYTIDLICHGVPGIELFREYIESLNKRYNGKCIGFSFRRKYNNEIHFEEEIKFQINSEEKTIIIPLSDSSYYNMFMHNESYRECCYHCDYATIYKPADITIGDYFEAREDFPDFFTEDGPLKNEPYLNAILVRTEKGEELLTAYSAFGSTIEVDPNIVQMSHQQLCKPSEYSQFRFKAIKKYKDGGISAVNKLQKKISRKRRVQRFISKLRKSISRQ